MMACANALRELRWSSGAGRPICWQPSACRGRLPRARPVLLDNGRRRRDASLDHAAGLFPGLWVRAGRVAVAAHPAPAVSGSVGAKPEPRWNVAVPKPCCKEQHIQSPHAVRPFSIACRERDNTQSVTKPSLPTFGARDRLSADGRAVVGHSIDCSVEVI